jgi:hypothetical protein
MMIVLYKYWCPQEPDPDPAPLPGVNPKTANQKMVDDREPGMTDARMVRLVSDIGYDLCR